MGKKKGLGMCDILLLILGMIGALMGCSACLLGYYRQANPKAEVNWPLRKYYVKKLTDMSMRPTITWKVLKQDTCTKYEAAQMKYGNPQGQMLAKLMEHTLSIPLCGIKPNCREHMSERCIFYDYAVDDALVLILVDAASMCFLGLGGFCLMISNKPHWKMYAGVCVFFGGFMMFGACSWWAIDTDKYFHRMKKQSIYPYPTLSGWGFWCNIGGACNMMLGGVCGFISSMSSGKSKAPDMMDPMMAGPMGGQPMMM
jgi:hypothetical protein